MLGFILMTMDTNCFSLATLLILQWPIALGLHLEGCS